MRKSKKQEKVTTSEPKLCKSGCKRTSKIEGWCSVCYAKFKKGFYTADGSISPDIIRKRKEAEDKKDRLNKRRQQLKLEKLKEPALVWKAKPHQWRQIYGIGDTISLQLKREAFWLEQADRILDAADKQQVQIASYQCVSYPNRLGQIPDAPAIIYWKGDLHGTASKTMAVVS